MGWEIVTPAVLSLPAIVEPNYSVLSKQRLSATRLNLALLMPKPQHGVTASHVLQARVLIWTEIVKQCRLSFYVLFWKFHGPPQSKQRLEHL